MPHPVAKVGEAPILVPVVTILTLLVIHADTADITRFGSRNVAVRPSSRSWPKIDRIIRH